MDRFTEDKAEVGIILVALSLTVIDSMLPVLLESLVNIAIRGFFHCLYVVQDVIQSSTARIQFQALVILFPLIYIIVKVVPAHRSLIVIWHIGPRRKQIIRISLDGAERSAYDKGRLFEFWQYCREGR